MRWALLLALAGCGAGSPGEPRVPLALYLDGAFPLTQLSAFQVTLLTQGSGYDCATVVQSCVKFEEHTAPVALPNGTFPVKLTGDGGVATQDVTVTGIPIGKDYLVVIEAASNASPPQLLGSSCNEVPQITAGTNPPLVAAPITAYPGGPVGCDPLP